MPWENTVRTTTAPCDCQSWPRTAGKEGKTHGALMKLTRELLWGYWEEFHHYTLICLLLTLKPETAEDEHRLTLVLNLTDTKSPRDGLGTLMENYLVWLCFWLCLWGIDWLWLVERGLGPELHKEEASRNRCKWPAPRTSPPQWTVPLNSESKQTFSPWSWFCCCHCWMFLITATRKATNTQAKPRMPQDRAFLPKTRQLIIPKWKHKTAG